MKQADIIYYGPHPCKLCGVEICKAGVEDGGKEFDYPQSLPIYPNSFRPHICKASGTSGSTKKKRK